MRQDIFGSHRFRHEAFLNNGITFLKRLPKKYADLTQIAFFEEIIQISLWLLFRFKLVGSKKQLIFVAEENIGYSSFFKNSKFKFKRNMSSLPFWTSPRRQRQIRRVLCRAAESVLLPSGKWRSTVLLHFRSLTLQNEGIDIRQQISVTKNQFHQRSCLPQRLFRRLKS